jgi:hypothetical protein
VKRRGKCHRRRADVLNPITRVLRYSGVPKLFDSLRENDRPEDSLEEMTSVVGRHFALSVVGLVVVGGVKLFVLAWWMKRRDAEERSKAFRSSMARAGWRSRAVANG